jgi:hypothetical protein
VARIKKLKLAKVKRKLDRLFSDLILSRDERVCQWCGAVGSHGGVHIDNSHIIPREYLATRWNPDNSLALCFGCHKRRGRSWHGSPLEAVWWLRSYLGDAKCEKLLELSRQPFELTHETAAQIEADLRERLASITPPQKLPVKRLIALSIRASNKVIRLLQGQR